MEKNSDILECSCSFSKAIANGCPQVSVTQHSRSGFLAHIKSGAEVPKQFVDLFSLQKGPKNLAHCHLQPYCLPKKATKSGGSGRDRTGKAT
jgi:hypothetical protein